MSGRSLGERARGWRGVCLIAITYVYFLIFAQFAFLNRLEQLGIADTHLQAVMAAMALGGIGFSLVAALRSRETWARLRLQLSLVICGGAAGCTLFPLNLGASVALAFLIGAGLGLLTVTLVSNLRLWMGAGNGILRVGLGTGIGYFVCNVPALFTASPNSQAGVAACLCAAGVLAAWKTEPIADAPPVVPRNRQTSFAFLLIAFTALVWLDSAAFFIIQNTPSLRAETWQGTVHLWMNAFLHLGAALLSGFLLRRIAVRDVLALAVLALSAACLLLHQPGQAATASLFYPVGVSLYSVALVAYPSMLAQSSSRQRPALRAGLIYAIAGWIGSAMGIGMAQHLRQVPLPFVASAALLVLGPAVFLAFQRHPREVGLTSAALAVALCLHLLLSALARPAAAVTTEVERGRQVYIAEGCINCHSQYVRPQRADVLMWGPTETIEELRSQHPPLIGNRRQGPDLSQVGGRRSPLWLKAHFFHPAEVSHGSFMPSYASLFQGTTRGDDLVRYLSSLKSPSYAEHVAMEQAWVPAGGVKNGDAGVGPHLYGQYCGTCHETTGATRRVWASSLRRLPPDLQRGPWLDVRADDSIEARTLSLARIIKFGIPGTDMPGHEYLSDQDVSSIALWLNRTMVLPEQVASLPSSSGEKR
jgi:cytochrome c oxidase cbb3-type subunit 2